MNAKKRTVRPAGAARRKTVTHYTQMPGVIHRTASAAGTDGVLCGAAYATMEQAFDLERVTCPECLRLAVRAEAGKCAGCAIAAADALKAARADGDVLRKENADLYGRLERALKAEEEAVANAAEAEAELDRESARAEAAEARVKGLTERGAFMASALVGQAQAQADLANALRA